MLWMNPRIPHLPVENSRNACCGTPFDVDDGGQTTDNAYRSHQRKQSLSASAQPYNNNRKNSASL